MTTLARLAAGAVTVAVLGVVWVGVQRAWGRSFARACSDPDVLAGRGGSCGCSHDDDCERGGER